MSETAVVAKPKIRTICIDTLTEIQTNQLAMAEKKPNFDKWADYGKDIYSFVIELQKRGVEVILILGPPGVGKSSGMMHLKTKTNIWYNADNKNPVWIGGKTEYGKKHAPKAPYHVIPKTYKDILNHIDMVAKKGGFEDEVYAIITGHVEDFKVGNQNRQQLKTMGKQATNWGIEAKLETVLYAEVVMEGTEAKYVLNTENDGNNTARSPMGVFEPIIANNYQFVIDKLLNAE